MLEFFSKKYILIKNTDHQLQRGCNCIKIVSVCSNLIFTFDRLDCTVKIYKIILYENQMVNDI